MPGRSGWPSRDPLGDNAFFISSISALNKTLARQFKAESLMPSYGFCRNNPNGNIDTDGRINLVAAGVIVTLTGAIIMPAACKFHADNVITKANEDTVNTMSSLDPNYKDGDIGRDGTLTDAFQHCLGACRLMQNKGPCCFSWVVKKGLNDYENGLTDPAALQDLANNKVGVGISGNCVSGCISQLKSGNLTCLDKNGKLTPCKL